MDFEGLQAGAGHINHKANREACAGCMENLEEVERRYLYIYISLFCLLTSFEEVRFQWAGIMRNDSS